MTAKVKKLAQDHGLKLEIISIERLAEIKEDIEQLKNREELNGYQKWIIDENYVYNLPRYTFEAKSIIIVIAELALKYAEFSHNGKKVKSITDSGNSNAAQKVKGILRDLGYNSEAIEWTPEKRLAVRSGLVKYGRNNITYDEDFGSYLNILVFASDIPAGEHTWREAMNMDLCKTCRICIDNCPTGAILQERFLIDNDLCLTKYNEWGTEDFPEWVPKTAHNQLIGCNKCQVSCPMNKKRIDGISEIIRFSEEETAMLLAGVKKEDMPDGLAEKVNMCDFKYYMESVPRNLKALFENPEIVI